MFHQIILIGRLGRDVEGKYTPNGKFVAEFSLASDIGFGDKKKTLWTRIVAWEKTGEACNNYLKKGSRAMIIGTLNPDESGSPRIWTRQDGTPATSFEVTASTVRFLDSRGVEQVEDSEITF